MSKPVDHSAAPGIGVQSGQELRGDIADATRKGVDRSREAAQQLGERAGQYYETTRERASELYTQAAEKVGEVAQTARETATRRTNTVAAAIDASSVSMNWNLSVEDPTLRTRMFTRKLGDDDDIGES